MIADTTGSGSILFFDPSQNAIIDRSDGSILPLDAIGESGLHGLPMHLKQQIQCKRDEDYARSLSEDISHSRRGKLLGGDDGYDSLGGIELRRAMASRNRAYIAAPSEQLGGDKSLEQEIIELHSLYPGGDIEANNDQPQDPDFSLARALQALEFEIAADVYGEEDDSDFRGKEYRASKCKKQLLTISTFIILVQIGLLVAMVEDDGYDDSNELYGPSAYTMVRYGAKQAGLIKYRNEWWRLISPVMLHAGMTHLLSNGLIQLRVGGYLNLVYGNFKFLVIYFGSGIFGNICSCIFLTDSVGIGSSGAVLGILCSWLIWIVFRWKKIPPINKPQRNCQLITVTAAVAITLAFSFSEYIDWAGHFGGSIQGFLLGGGFLANELDNNTSKWAMRVIGFGGSLFLYIYSLAYFLTVTNPDRRYLELFDANDDWN